MIEGIMMLYLLGICLVAAVTDWKKGKIYNRWLSLGMIPASILVVLYYYGHRESIRLFLMNLLAAIAIAIIFYALKMWGAGDSKLWMFLNFLFPAGWYVTTDSMLFPSMLIFMLIFLEAYLYIFLESIWYRFFKKKKGIQLQKEKFDSQQVWNLLFSISFLSLVYTLCAYFMGEYYESNRIFFAVVGVLLTSQLVAVQFRGKKVLTVILCILYVAGAVMSGGMRMNDLGLTILLVLVSHFSLKFAEKYNYEWVKTSEVKSGMILSCFAVQQFLCSRVKGLPESTDETTKSRITQEQAESIHRWEKSKYGKEYIMVVRYIPFAVFILAGLITYFVGVVIIK